MQITIKPQDKTEPEKLELLLHPTLISRLKSYARSLNDSDLNYVAAQIFDQVLPNGKTTKQPAAKSVPKAAKDKKSEKGISAAA